MGDPVRPMATGGTPNQAQCDGSEDKAVTGLPHVRQERRTTAQRSDARAH